MLLFLSIGTGLEVPRKTPQFMAYQRTIVRAQKSFVGEGWVTYDSCYRRKASLIKSLDWATVDFTLYNVLTKRLREGQKQLQGAITASVSTMHQSTASMPLIHVRTGVRTAHCRHAQLLTTEDSSKSVSYTMLGQATTVGSHHAGIPIFVWNVVGHTHGPAAEKVVGHLQLNMLGMNLQPGLGNEHDC
jgi:hypothetical protein